MERKNRVRLRLFNGSRALEERERFRNFIQEETPAAYEKAKDYLWNLVFSVNGSERISRLLQYMFIWYYENYLRNSRPLKVRFVARMRIHARNYDYEKVLDSLYENLKRELRRVR